MGMLRSKWLIIIGILFMGISCENMLFEPDAAADPVSIFEEIWDFTDRHYSFFEEKNIDWLARGDYYRQYLQDEMGPIGLFDLCADMLYELRDGHVNLLSSFDRSRNWAWFLNSPENFNYAIIQRNYFIDRQRFVGPLHYFVFEGEPDLSGADDVVYVYYGSFAQAIGGGHLDMVINAARNRAGLIIDVRSNGGGSIENARRLAERFTDQRVFVGTNWVKNGPGHEEFRQSEVHIEPHDGLVFNGPVVVLTNRKSYSATTYFAQYMKALPNAILVGDTTGGGGGMPAVRDLANGWQLRVSSSRFIDPDGMSIESGVVPDYLVYMSASGQAEGRDDILEKAIEIVRNAH